MMTAISLSTAIANFTDPESGLCLATAHLLLGRRPICRKFGRLAISSPRRSLSDVRRGTV